ncbi:MAG: peptidylprolyl isomerase [Acidobacteriota bacterium]
MFKVALVSVWVVMLLATALPTPAEDNPVIVIETTMGEITAELYPSRSPKTVENFLAYVKDGFYDGTIFHRVMRGFMIQGGGFTADMRKKPTRDPIRNEARNGLKNRIGTLAMARLPDIHSATSQFFINTADNRSLDHKGITADRYGYAVFGKVVEGMEVVRAIEKVKTTQRAGHGNVPVEPVVIKAIRLATEESQEPPSSSR